MLLIDLTSRWSAAQRRTFKSGSKLMPECCESWVLPIGVPALVSRLVTGKTAFRGRQRKRQDLTLPPQGPSDLRASRPLARTK
jgi:hypothetical protein